MVRLICSGTGGGIYAKLANRGGTTQLRSDSPTHKSGSHFFFFDA